MDSTGALTAAMPPSPRYPSDADAFYRDLTSRNRHFVPPDVQAGLRRLKILIAGCGSTGGACIEALARVGVCHFWLADNGDFELSNLNRQHARLENIGQNKAAFHAAEVGSINPHARVTTATDGITEDNVESFVAAADLVFDAIDITTADGVKGKVLLHRMCHALKKPMLSGVDLGFVQWGMRFDYRKGDLAPLHGAAEALLQANHPFVALFKTYPLSIVPTHALPLLIDLLDGRSPFASQIGCTSDALSAIIVPVVMRFVQSGDLVRGWKFDLSKHRYTSRERLGWFWRGFALRAQVRRKLEALR